MNMRLLKDRILVKPLEGCRGEVMAFGPAVSETHQDSIIIYREYAGTDVTIDDVNYIVMDESDILVILGKEKE